MENSVIRNVKCYSRRNEGSLLSFERSNPNAVKWLDQFGTVGTIITHIRARDWWKKPK